MNFMKRYYPYIIGFFIGLVIIPLFVRGFGLSWTDRIRLGEVLMLMGLIIWPLYIILVFVITGLLKLKINKEGQMNRIKQFRRSTLLAPLGALVSVLLIMGLSLIFGG